jgi:hypothetical protein
MLSDQDNKVLDCSKHDPKCIPGYLQDPIGPAQHGLCTEAKATMELTQSRKCSWHQMVRTLMWSCLKKGLLPECNRAVHHVLGASCRLLADRRCGPLHVLVNACSFQILLRLIRTIREGHRGLVGLAIYVQVGGWWDLQIMCQMPEYCAACTMNVLPQCQQYQQVIGVGVFEFSLHAKRDKATVKIFDGNVRCMAKMEFAVALSLLAPAPTTIQTGKYPSCMHEMHSARRLHVWGTFYRGNDDFVGITTPLLQACASDSTLPRDHDPGSNRTLQAPAFPQH